MNYYVAEEVSDLRENNVRCLQRFSMPLEGVLGKRQWKDFGVDQRLGKDGPSLFYLRLCEQYRENPPEEAWDGVVRMAEK